MYCGVYFTTPIVAAIRITPWLSVSDSLEVPCKMIYRTNHGSVRRSWALSALNVLDLDIVQPREDFTTEVVQCHSVGKWTNVVKYCHYSATSSEFEYQFRSLWWFCPMSGWVF